MSGLIEGYRYDIFISYRQNDNKYDGWVTEFVTNLKKELEATIKDRVTVFFDENPEDGLLENYSVDKSIEEKLKCLIFIPVISQTYCDITSYAWQLEFRAFNRLATYDRFGRDVLLPNDNVASRILPVMIHEIDPDDTLLLENELGGKLRYIDFIYRSAGVNRPLRVSEEHLRDNLNKTYYRDQINKVANAIKDILTVLKIQSRQLPVTKITEKERLERKKSFGKIRIAKMTSIFLLILIIITFYNYGLREPKIARAMEKSIAVLPFKNDSPNDSNGYFVNGLMEEILNKLQKIKDIRVISRTSVEQYRETSSSIPQIAKELGVNYIVEGSAQRYGNSFRINVQLWRAKKEHYLWGKIYEQKISTPLDIINVQSSVAQSIVSELEGTITPQEKQLIEKIPTANLTAYDFYTKGKEELSKFWIDVSDNDPLFKAEKMFKKALEADPTFVDAIVGKAEVIWNYRDLPGRQNVKDSVLMLTDIALSYDDKNAEAYIIKGWYYDEEGMADKALEFYSRAIELNPNDWKAYFGLAELYDFEDPVKSLTNLQKAASLTHGAVEMPTLLRHIGGELLVTGFIDKAALYFSRAFELDGDSAIYLTCLGGIEHNQGNFDKALVFYKRAYSIKKNYTEVIHDLAVYSQLSGKYKESLEYYRQLDQHNNLNFNNHRMGYSLWMNGFHEESGKYFNKQLQNCKSVLKNGRRSDLIFYAYYDLAGIYAFKGDKKKAYQYLRLFDQSKNCFLYMLTLIKNDPLMESIKTEPEFLSIIDNMESKYKNVHEEVNRWIVEQDDF
jgi:TolB-like protein/Tfp pilus assembly protein PilF